MAKKKMTDSDARAVQLYKLLQQFSDRFGWSFARIAREGLKIPSQWLYRYISRAKVAMGEAEPTEGDRSPSKGTVRAMELLIEVHELQAGDRKTAALQAAQAEMAKLQESLAASVFKYDRWSVNALREECTARSIPGRSGDTKADYVRRLRESDAAK